MYKKESILLPSSESLTVPSLNGATSAINRGTSIKVPILQLQEVGKAEMGVAETFRSYLSTWTAAAENFDISSNLKYAVEQIKSFPENSVAFYIGVKEVLKIAKDEANELVEDVSSELETKGYVKSFKSYALASLNKVAQVVAFTYEAVSELSSRISKAVFGDRLHDSMADFLNKYLGAFGNFLMDNIKALFGEERREEKFTEEGYKFRYEIGKLGNYAVREGEGGSDKKDFVGELIDKCSDFLSYSKNYFAHNILDNEDESSRFKPEVLIEGDLKSRPVFDAYPPEWALKKMQLEEAQLSEQRSRKSTVS
jgi:hypothetical protein